MPWSVLGSVLILFTTWYKVELTVKLNTWYGAFYDTIQKALTTPNSVEQSDFLAQMATFFKIAGIFIIVAVFLEFFIRHFVFRWRTAMNDYYLLHWEKLRHIEGASQRIQEDTMRFARIVEGLGVSFLRSIMVLFAFLPLLWELSVHIKEVPIFGELPHALTYTAILTSVVGTGLLALVGIKLPGLEFKNQKAEAAFRKELVLGEDHAERAQPPTVKDLFSKVRGNYMSMYLHYLYFDFAKWTYLQSTVLFPIFIMMPSILSGVITFGIMTQVSNAFSKVEESFQFLVNSWTTIVELISVQKRLRAFERQIEGGEPLDAAEVESLPEA
jgi:peptide/bleomycin uptake transporter